MTQLPCNICGAKRVHWKKLAMMTECFHLGKVLLSKSLWSIRKSAIDLNRSMGSVSEDLRISLALRIYPEVSEFRTREEALEYLKRRNKCAHYPCNQWSIDEIKIIISSLSQSLKDA